MKQLYLGMKNILCDISSDKYLHFIVCMILTLLIAKITNEVCTPLAVVFSIGVLEELLDKFIRKEKFDVDDVGADAYGI